MANVTVERFEQDTVVIKYHAGHEYKWLQAEDLWADDWEVDGPIAEFARKVGIDNVARESEGR